MGYGEIADRLHRFVCEVCSGPRFRRRLRYDPAAALGEHGLASASVPPGLPVRHWKISAVFDNEHLYGPGTVRPADRGPLAARLVLYGARPLALVHGPEARLAALRGWGESHGLVGLLSPYEFTAAADEGKGGYSNLQGGMRPARSGSGAWRALVLAPDENQALLGWLSLLFGWERFLGGLLGYPECCVDAFVRHWPEVREHHQGDMAVLLAQQAGRGPHFYGLNLFQRYFGFELLQHFPCSPDCAASARLARRYISALAMASPENWQGLADRLASVSLFTERQGVFHLGRPEVSADASGWTVRPDPRCLQTTQPDSPLLKALSRGAAVTSRADSPGLVAIGEERIEGYLLDFSCGAGEQPADWVRTFQDCPTGVFSPGPGGQAVELARLAAARSLQEEIHRIGEGDIPPSPRGAGGFVRQTSDLLHSLASTTMCSSLSPGLAAIQADPATDAGALERLGRLLCHVIGARAHLQGLSILPCPPGEVYIPHLHARLRTGGPVALRANGSRLRITWMDGETVDMGPAGVTWTSPRAAERLMGGIRAHDWPLLNGVAGDLPGLVLAPVQSITPEKRQILTEGLKLLAWLSPPDYASMQRLNVSLAIVAGSAEATVPLPDLLCLPVGALGNRLVAAVALAESAARGRVALLWPFLAGNGATKPLAGRWREPGCSRLATVAAGLARWRILLAAAPRLTGEEAESGRALLASLAEEPAGPDPDWLRGLTGSRLREEIRREIGAARVALAEESRRILTSEPTREEASASEPTESSPIVNIPPADPGGFEEARRHFEADGYAVVDSFLEQRLFQVVCRESADCVSDALKVEGAGEHGNCRISPVGEWGKAAADNIRSVLEEFLKRPLCPNWQASGYVYFEGPHGFQDFRRETDPDYGVTLLIHLAGFWANDRLAGPGMCLHLFPEGAEEDARPVAAILARPNRGLIFDGVRLPQQRPRLAAGEAVCVLAVRFDVRRTE